MNASSSSRALPVREHRVATRLGAIRVRDVGEGPVALLWPSMFVDGSAWDAMIPLLAPARRLLVVDGPGYGGSDPLRRRSSIAECSDVAVELLDALGVDTVDWTGNAWGGHVGMDMAVRFPERLRSLAAIGSPTHPVKEPTKIRLLTVLLRLLGPVRPVVDAVLDAQFTDESREAGITEPVTRALASSPRGSLVRTTQSFILDRVDVEASLAGVATPCLFVSTDDRGEWDPRDAERVAASIPGAEHVMLRGARTLVPIERPAELATALLAFWSRVPA